MLTGLKMSSLACKCVFYRSQHNAKGNPLNSVLKGLKCKNDIYRWIELNEQVRKMSFV